VEVPVDVPLGHLCGVRNIADGHLAVAAGLERLDRGGNDPLAVFGRRGGRPGSDRVEGRDVALVVGEAVGGNAFGRRDQALAAVVVDGAGGNATTGNQFRERQLFQGEPN
jgi:hypothetical protein